MHWNDVLIKFDDEHVYTRKDAVIDRAIGVGAAVVIVGGYIAISEAIRHRKEKKFDKALKRVRGVFDKGESP